MPATLRRRAGGFSLIELIVVMVIVGLLAGMIALFIVNPVRGYLDSSRRAVLVDIANTALMRMARDVRLALPNSVRVRQNGGVFYLEFLLLDGGGRYREQIGAAGDDPLDFATRGVSTDTRFDLLGPPISMAAGAEIVIYNLALDADTDAYQGGNRRAYTGTLGTVSRIDFAAAPGGAPFPMESPARRFHVVRSPVTYACNPATGELRRYAGYGIGAAQPADQASPPLSTAGNNNLLASKVSRCRFAYVPGASETLGQLTLWLELTDEGESVSLYREVVVSNEP
ncbi:MSHA biogenesis protein MshO [Sulfuritortus calidifontis]|uniref:MSHA biogenesis protein MshO n=1 Tax=Sulfuritortus calidifontis TaxID=1914471 RepID=A0A4R3JV96_9PROT|nr:prepilin-type N-terminal cleavage/methylation domain-containing protein [Sulfuritortus calidifontis]TCS71889.1 MSHA biogenesis protein MshO [Sulfuritortus calidifontis]